MRQFIRHPIDVPVEISTQGHGASPALHSVDLSQGGLALRAGFFVAPGAHVQVRIPHVHPPFEAQARVAWCHSRADEGFELGVSFLDAEAAFMARMVEQVCHIEDYRQTVRRLEARDLSAEEAAEEWIARHAAQFPEIGSQPARQPGSAP